MTLSGASSPDLIIRRLPAAARTKRSQQKRMLRVMNALGRIQAQAIQVEFVDPVDSIVDRKPANGLTRVVKVFP